MIKICFLSKHIVVLFIALVLTSWLTGVYFQYIKYEDRTDDSFRPKSFKREYHGAIKNINPQPKRLIVLYAYMRGGSSFLGSTLKQNKDVFYWYEPEWDIYNKLLASPIYIYSLHVLLNSSHHYRRPTELERNYLRSQLKIMLTCKMDKITAEQLTSWTYDHPGVSRQDFAKCMLKSGMRNVPVQRCQQMIRRQCGHFVSDNLKRGCHKFMLAAHGEGPVSDVPQGFPPVQLYKDCINNVKQNLLKCLPMFKESCVSPKYKVIKLLRADLDFVEDLMKDWDEVRVIYQTRDPRGTLISRQTGSRQFTPDIKDEAPLLCQKMLRDFEAFQRLEQKYPGKFLRTSYEQLAIDPIGTTEMIYEFLGMPLPPHIKQWMHSLTHSNSDGWAFGQNRANSTATAFKWRGILSKAKKDIIDQDCKNVYSKFGYDL